MPRARGREGKYNKRNINGKRGRGANEKNEKRRVEASEVLGGKCERSSWHPSNRGVDRGRNGCTSCITRGVRCIQRIRMHHARKEMANGGFGDWRGEEV